MIYRIKMRQILLFIIFFPLVVYAQNSKIIDSLKLELKKADSDSLKIEINNQLFKNYYQYNPEASRKYYTEILSLADDSNNKKGMYKGYFAKAVYFTMLSRLDSALHYFKRAQNYAKKLDGDKPNIEALLAISHTYLWKNEFDSARSAGLMSLELSEKIHDSTKVAVNFKNLGEIYSMENNLDSATSFYLKAIRILESTGKGQSKLGDLYAAIGEVYMNLDELDKAQEFLNKSIAVFKKIHDKDGTMFASAMMGGLYFNKEEYNEAIETLLTVLKYYQSVGDPYRISETNRYLGLAYLNKSNYTEAEKYLSDAVDKGRQADEPINLAETLMAHGKLYLQKKSFSKAQKSFVEADGLYSDVGFLKGKLKSTQMLSQLYEKTKEYARSNAYLKAYTELKDSLNDVENASVVQELEAQYQNEKQQHQIDLLEAQNQLKEREKSRQRNIFISSIIVALIVIFLLYSLYRTNQRANKKLKELDALKSRFFANISHEFRTPLTLISGPVEDRLKLTGLDQEERAELEMVHRNSKQLLNLVDQLLDLSKIESGGLKLNIECGDLSNVIKTLSSSFEYPASQNDIDFNLNVPGSSQEEWFDRDVIRKIVTNLLSNAIKYTPERGHIDFSVRYENKKVIITCENSGKGIPEKDIDKIFDRFYQQNGEAGGVGIGLALLKELTELLHGNVSVSSIPNASTTFQVVLPIDKASFKGEDLMSGESQPVDFPEIDVTEYEEDDSNTQNDDTPLLLIVDDNIEVRMFVKNILKNDYRILEAENGSKGMDVAIEQVPDLIISDVMMPEINGVALCNTLKADERTSHIPIILLTAKAGEENELEGYETGADDYIIKPFNSEILKVRIEKLIELRKNLQKRFSQEIVLKPKELSITPADEKFLDKVQRILDDHLSNNDFTAESFSKEIGMSRMQLHRKLKALTGLSTNHFIRRQRINIAADLLSRSDINISEVGYMVGFNDPSYFAKCFKTHYGCTPSEYVDMESKK